jgi:hypothetical protein
MPMRVLTCIANAVSEMSEMRALVSDDIIVYYILYNSTLTSLSVRSRPPQPARPLARPS